MGTRTDCRAVAAGAAHVRRWDGRSLRYSRSSGLHGAAPGSRAPTKSARMSSGGPSPTRRALPVRCRRPRQSGPRWPASGYRRAWPRTTTRRMRSNASCSLMFLKNTRGHAVEIIEEAQPGLFRACRRMPVPVSLQPSARDLDTLPVELALVAGGGILHAFDSLPGSGRFAPHHGLLRQDISGTDRPHGGPAQDGYRDPRTSRVQAERRGKESELQHKPSITQEPQDPV